MNTNIRKNREGKWQVYGVIAKTDDYWVPTFSTKAKAIAWFEKMQKEASMPR